MKPSKTMKACIALGVFIWSGMCIFVLRSSDFWAWFWATSY